MNLFGGMGKNPHFLRYGVGSPRRPARARSLLTGVSPWRHAGGLALRSAGALDGASPDVDRGGTPTAGGVSLPERWRHRYHNGVRRTRLPYLFGPGSV